jgi:MFS family permease
VALALAAFFLAERAPALTLGVMLLVLLIVTGVGGVLMPAWMDMIGRVIPTTLRGRFFGFANLAASVGGLAASVVTASILATVPAPASYGLCFVGAAVCLALSFVALAVVREPAAPSSAPAVPLREYLARIPALLARDPNLTWYLTARAFGVVGTIGNGFYTVYALRAWDAPAAQAGVFTTLLFVGQMVGNAALGWLADRRGHRLVIIAGLVATVTANLTALAAPTLAAFGLVFVMMGIQIAAMNVSSLNVLLEFAPAPSEQPTYVGLGTTLVAPIAFAAPLAAGLLADAFGFLAVFGVAAVAAGVALALLIARVRDPRSVVARAA